jgi:hypothetical protein
MNKPFIIPTRLKIDRMQAIIELKEMLKEMLEFFVLQPVEFVQTATEKLSILKNKWLRIFELTFNSLYRASNSSYRLSFCKFEFSEASNSLEMKPKWSLKSK